MRNGLWSIVVGGIVGVLLWAGPVGAQPFPGGLPRCQASLGTCTTNLGTCQTDLAACLAEPTVVFPGDGVDGPALSYTNHGDGTVTDNNTLLMWEVKDTGSGIHGVNQTFLWSDSFTVFLATLNTAPCFASHCDWRMPNVKELQSIVDYSQFDPAIASSFPGSTAAGFYWSSTATAGNASHAWVVGFDVGGVFFDAQNVGLRVRAVRGGR